MDENGDGIVNGNGTSLDGVLYAMLRDAATNQAIQTVAVAANGSYSFGGLSANTYSVVIASDTTISFGNLPSAYAFNGEAIGATQDPNVDGTQNATISVTMMAVSRVDFGVETRAVEFRGTESTGNDEGENFGSVATILQSGTASMTATLAPNPAATGAIVSVRLQGRNGELVRAIVTNMAGQVICQSSALNADIVEVPTWPGCRHVPGEHCLRQANPHPVPAGEVTGTVS